jgi:maleylacetoacetate isomerase
VASSACRPSSRSIRRGSCRRWRIDGLVLTQSLAIIEYLDETRPAPPLLPARAAARARVRSLAQLVASDIHPVNNLRVLQYLRDARSRRGQRDEWYRHWVIEGLRALEARLAREPGTGRFCHGDTPGLADCCLVPQLYNARRYAASWTPSRPCCGSRRPAASWSLPGAAPDVQPDARAGA